MQTICRTCLTMEGEFSPIHDSKGLLANNCIAIADMLGDLTNHTPKKSDGMPEMVCLACVREINRCYFFKIKCLNSESMLKQFLNSCEEDQDADITDTLFEKNQDVDIVKAVGKPYNVIDLEDEGERSVIIHEVEKQKQLHYNNKEAENSTNAPTPIEEKGTPELGGCILPRVDTPDVEFVENDKVPCVVIDSDDERESLKLEDEMEKNLDLLHEEHLNVSNAGIPIEKIQKPESNVCVPSQVETPDIEFIETAKESYVVIDSDEECLNFDISHELKNHEDKIPIELQRNAEATVCKRPQVEFLENDKVPYAFIHTEDEIERMEIENKVDRDLNSTLSNKENENVANTLKTDDEPYVVIDLECESERLEIKHEVQKHLQLLHSNNQDEKMQSVNAGACIHPQVDELDVEIVETNKETYIVVDSEDETVQFEIEHDVKEHSPLNIIKQYHSKKSAGLLKIKDKLKPSFTASQSAVENYKVSKESPSTEPSEISDDFRHIFDYFDAVGEPEPNQYCPVDFAPSAQQLQCAKCAMTFLDPSNLRAHIACCEVVRQDKSTVGQCNSSTFRFLISNENTNDESDPVSCGVRNETNMTTSCANNDASAHRCPVCQECFAHRLLLTHHMRLHPGGLRFYCPICNRVFTTKSSLNDHALRHGEKKPNKCDECPQTFYSIKELRLHVRGHTGDSPFVCDLCQPSSKSEKDLDYREADKYFDQKENVLVKDKDESETNAINDVVGVNDEMASSFSTSTKEPMTDAAEHDELANDNVTHQRQLYMQAYRCFHCGAGFEKKKSLEIHINQFKCSPKPFVCCKCKRQKLPTFDICNKVFTNGDDLLKHNLEIQKLKNHSYMRRYKGEQPNVYGNGFSSRRYLSQHTLQHRIAKLFKCEKCPRAFINRAELTLHFRRHGVELPYARPLCPKRYAALSGCRAHQQKHIDEQRLTYDVEVKNDPEPNECMDVHRDV